MNGNEIADTIIKQMGGFGKLRAMVGADLFGHGEDYVQFRFKGSRKFNTCKVTLDFGSDLYTLALYKISPRMGTCKKVYELEGMYAEMLKPVFEEETGLYLSL